MNKLIERVKAILLNPKPTWEVIKTEPGSVGQIYTEYLVPLAAIPAVAGFIGTSLVGVHVLFATVRVSVGAGLLGAVLQFGLTLAGVFVAGLVIDALAPTFGSTKNSLNAFKVAAYSMTPALVAGVLSILPMLSVLAILASLYGIYLLYLGLQSLMACPADKAIGYTIVSILVMAAVYLVIGLIVGSVTGAGMGMRGLTIGRRGGDVSMASRVAAAAMARHGVRADVSASGGKVTVKTEDGTATYTATDDGAGGSQVTVESKEGKSTVVTGAGARIPDNFPKDVYLPAGATVQTATTVPNGWSLMLQTKDSADKVLAAMKAKMTGGGWKETMTQSQDDGGSMAAYQKDGRTAMYTLQAGKPTQVQITVAQESSDGGE
jgi:hypothetical protein